MSLPIVLVDASIYIFRAYFSMPEHDYLWRWAVIRNAYCDYSAHHEQWSASATCARETLARHESFSSLSHLVRALVRLGKIDEARDEDTDDIAEVIPFTVQSI